ncbi:ABC transporter ATP-binding protein [Alicyclobacillaceae bacterium I2511]|nr:ABC transporter ATP-binding protein [Alicyclobacillaceae bacterium I2511]
MQILWDVHLWMNQGECVLVLGSNGAGKTTLLKTLVGLVDAWSGEVELAQQSLIKMSVDRRIHAGIGYLSETGTIPSLTVEDNLRLGGFYLSRTERERRGNEMYENFPILREKRKHLADSLSGGQRKMLGAAKALMSNPKLLIMDEPSAGLSPRLVTELIEILKGFHKQGLSLLIAEQNVKFLDIAERVYVLDSGRIGFAGTVKELQADDAIRKAYFGVTGQ